MLFSPNKHFFLSFSNKQKLDKTNKKIYLPTLIFFGMLAETRVFFFLFVFLGQITIFRVGQRDT